MKHKIFINPGHCCKCDPGAVNDSLHINEAEICRDVGDILNEILSKKYFTIVEQSNNLCGEDSQCYNDSVCAHANTENADIFVSIHCNSFTSDSANGTEVFWHPSSENGEKLGKLIQKEITSRLGTENRYPNMERGKQLAVCKYTKMPAVLVELAFISNKDDAQKLITKKYDFADAIATAIDNFFK